MKIRITIMTENDKHLDEKYSKEFIEQKAKDGCKQERDAFE